MAAGGAGEGQRLDFWFTAWRRELYSTLPKLAVDLAVRAERQGWSGMWVIDSQNLAGDPYASLALAARETGKLEMGPGVTNPYTRHPAVTATRGRRRSRPSARRPAAAGPVPAPPRGRCSWPGCRTSPPAGGCG